jgi:small subunit ribosomal protein S18
MAFMKRPMKNKFGKPGQKGPNKRKTAKTKRNLKCRFCTKEGCPRPVYVDYKDLRTLKVMITRDGHVLARRRTGNCAKFQRAVRRAILRARYMGLLPYVMRDD